MAMPIELDLDDEDEFEVALNHAPERDLVDLAGILGRKKSFPTPPSIG